MHDAPIIPPRDQRPDYSDEISMVDLVATLIRRRRVFYAVLIAFTLAGLVQVAQKDGDNFVQSLKTAIATLENRWLPEVQTA